MQENSAGTYEEIKSIVSSSNITNCRFSDDKTFFFLSGVTSQIHKYNGSTFEFHQNTSLVGSLDYWAKGLFRSPYFIHPEKNGDGDVNIKFFALNTNTGLWEVAFERTYTG